MTASSSSGPLSIVIFGASGDLTSRKLMPALFELFQKSRLPRDVRLVGLSRSALTSEAWREQLRASTREFAGSTFSEDAWRAFAECVHYQPGDASREDHVQALAALLAKLESGNAGTRLYYLATAPHLYGDIISQLGAAGLADETSGPRRVVVEKPFGADLPSARELNRTLHGVFNERQVYRIDHYLGKETVQNLLVLRFANSIFEPIWNRHYINHVQITVAEEVKVGRRAGYYDSAGVLRDMFQNHLLQLLMITAMEAPARYEADLVRDEKVKVLRSVCPLSREETARDTVRAQYAGYASEEGVPPGSRAATFAALKLNIENWRWNGVPFYLRSGKSMSCRTTQIVIQFHRPPHMLFTDGDSFAANRLVIQIQPAEGIQLHFQTKVPDEGMKLRLTDLDFRFAREFSGALPDAYQRLLVDAIVGDASLFARSDEVELAWGIIDPIQASWDEINLPELAIYPDGDWGPSSCTDWMRQQNREWFDVCPVLR